MKFPKNLQFRELIFADLVQRCMISRANRCAEYERLRSYYLFGASPETAPAVYNKIYPSIDLLTSFLFAAETTRFAIQLGAGVPKAELKKIPALVQRTNDRWQDSNADSMVSGAVTWSLVYNTMIVKLIQRGKETHPYLIEPHNFGVLREDVPMLDRQEAFCHVFYTTRPQLERDLQAHPNKTSILDRLTARPKQEGEMPAGVQRIIMSNINPLSGTLTGNVNDVLAGTQKYHPQTQEELVEMTELWAWDDEGNEGAGDWRVVTMTDPDVCIYDRLAGRDMFVPGEHPFTQVCPNPLVGYFFGSSEVDGLSQLQDEREHHMRQVRNLIDLNVTSPKMLQGVWGAVEEKDAALRNLGALISSPDMTSKIQEFKPTLPPDMWQAIGQIDQMFDERIGLNNLSRGQGDTGVRSKGQTDSLLRVGSSRPKKRALVIEDALERMATLYLKLDQVHNPDALYYEEGGKPVEFLAEQFTKDFMVKVDAHSSSPVFTEDQKKLGFELFDRQVIDGETLLDLIQPQNVQILKEKFKIMAKQRADAAAKKEQMEAVEAKGKLLKMAQ